MTALVTGAEGAIGRACVEAFLGRGHAVVAQDLKQTSPEVEGVTFVEGDLRSHAVLTELRELADEQEVKAVVAAHGVAGSAALRDCTPEFVDKVLAVNGETVPLLHEAVSDLLAARHGAFVAVASQAALTGEAENSAYCAGKFAVLGWIRSMAQSVATTRFHALCPGATESPLLRAAQTKFAAAAGMSADEYYHARAEQIALGRYGLPEEIAAAAVYLSDARGTAPTVLAVSGGDVLY